MDSAEDRVDRFGIGSVEALRHVAKAFAHAGKEVFAFLEKADA
jgi:hypothetical protein